MSFRVELGHSDYSGGYIHLQGRLKGEPGKIDEYAELRSDTQRITLMLRRETAVQLYDQLGVVLINDAEGEAF